MYGILEDFVARCARHVHANFRAKRFIDFGKLAKSVHNTGSFISKLGKDTAMPDHRSERWSIGGCDRLYFKFNWWRYDLFVTSSSCPFLKEKSKLWWVIPQRSYVRLIWKFQGLLTGSMAASVRNIINFGRAMRPPRALKVWREKIWTFSILR